MISVLSELKNRGVENILIVFTDGLPGFPDAIRSDLKVIYTVASEGDGRDALEDFGSKWNARYPIIYRSWSIRWEDNNVFFNYPPEIRKAIYTTNAIESLNFQLRKVTKNKSTFPNNNDIRAKHISRIMHLAIINASTKWTMLIHDWEMTLN